MCGILGYIGLNNKEFANKANLSLIAHRGPDNHSVSEENHLFFGHTRLSILDLSINGSQPMYSADGTYLLIFNGEIYNHLNLRNELLSEFKFKSMSDTETVLYGLIKFGKEFINKMNGIFALCFVNLDNNEFLLVRDQFGVKPLYYVKTETELFFSSELKALIPHLDSKTINKNSIINYLNYLWSPGEETPLKEVKKLLPGHLITGSTVNISDSAIEQYYNIPFNDSKIIVASEQELIDECESYLINAVKRQMLADVPLGFFLSGGLDSSLVVAIAKKLYPEEKFECFTIKTEGMKNEGFENDLDYAKKVAKHLDVKLNIVDGNSNILEYFDKVIYHLDEPQADPAPIYVYNICKQARKKGIKVLLGGTAGDDLFSGYRRHQALKYERIFNILPLYVRKIIKKIAISLNNGKPFFRRLNKLLANIDKGKSERLFGYFDWIDNKTLKNLMLESSDYDKHTYFKKLEKSLPLNTSDLNKMLFYELSTFLVDHNLNYTDKLSMAVGVEVRVPFLDKDLVEFSTRVPLHLKLNGNETKYILKKVAEKYLPKDVIYRPKTGFGAPVRQWITNDMTPLIEDYLSEDRVKKRAIFDHKQLKKLIEENKKGKVDLSYSIWSMLAIESWLIQFYD
jgi:asparagine synthase (glutamine-hydrolysing)